MTKGRLLLSGAAVVYCFGLVLLCFSTAPASERASWVWPCVLFLPVGVLLTLLLGRRRWWAALGFSLLGAAWVEAAQMVWMPQGYADGKDLVMSSAGAALGVGIAAGLRARRDRQQADTAELDRVPARVTADPAVSATVRRSEG